MKTMAELLTSGTIPCLFRVFLGFGLRFVVWGPRRRRSPPAGGGVNTSVPASGSSICGFTTFVAFQY
jgi:hypothetical protein